ncbi:MAG: hypothetical protein BWY31_00668 [Lentisphaerae bacterium ADurb.Bin242]|nr:MAG: hypothetical protein BWY31_00668 [Lentisphaerae bacterium ADurb.Bin242]
MEHTAKLSNAEALRIINSNLNVQVYRIYRSIGSVICMEACKEEILLKSPSLPDELRKKDVPLPIFCVYCRINLAHWKIYKGEKILLTSGFYSLSKCERILNQLIGEKLKKVRVILKQRELGLVFSNQYSIVVYEFAQYYGEDAKMIVFCVNNSWLRYTFKNEFELVIDE